MAQFCLAMKITPTEYRKLKLREYAAFIEVMESRSPSIEDIF